MPRALPYSEGRLEAAAGFLTLYRSSGKATVIALSEISALTVEERKAFRHPTLGLVFALALLLPCTGVLLVVLAQGNVAALLAFRLGAAVAFGLGLGSLVLWEVIRSPRICWLRVRSEKGEQRLALPGISRSELEEFAEALAVERGGPSSCMKASSR